MIKLPRMSKFLITLHFYSGKELRFFCGKLSTKYNNETEMLSSIQAEKPFGFPHYFNMNRVEAITSKKVFRLRWWR